MRMNALEKTSMIPKDRFDEALARFARDCLKAGFEDAYVARDLSPREREFAVLGVCAEDYVLHPVKNVWQHRRCAEYLPDRHGVMRRQVESRSSASSPAPKATGRRQDEEG